MRPDPVSAGLSGRCPACGRGKLFAGYLTLADQCSACGADFTSADTGDGPAVFVILIVGALIVPAMLIVEVAFQPPYWLHMALWVPLAMGLCLGLLRVFKGVLFCLQWRTRAREGRPG